MSEVSPVEFVVDDEHVRQAFARLLRSAGHLIETVGSASELLAHPAFMRHPTCILLDLALPDASGLDLQRALGAIAPIVLSCRRTAIEGTAFSGRTTRSGEYQSSRQTNGRRN